MRTRLAAKRIAKPSANRFINFSIGGHVVGEVRVSVRLVNSMDDGLFMRKKLKPERVRSCVENAMVDTGTVRLAIPESVQKKLELKIKSHRIIELADGSYLKVPITEAVVIEMQGFSTSEDAAVMGNEVLIGQSILETLDLYVDCKRHRLVPNPAHPDGPVIKAKRQ